MLLIELILTYFVCRAYQNTKQSWAKGLIPMGIMFVVALFMGVVLGVAGASAAVITTVGLFVDFALIGVLIWLLATVKPAV